MTAKEHQYAITTILTAVVTLALALIFTTLEIKFELKDAANFSIVFWIMYLLIQDWYIKKREKKE